jgi:hypothetical protein
MSLVGRGQILPAWTSFPLKSNPLHASIRNRRKHCAGFRESVPESEFFMKPGATNGAFGATRKAGPGSACATLDTFGMSSSDCSTRSLHAEFEGWQSFAHPQIDHNSRSVKLHERLANPFWRKRIQRTFREQLGLGTCDRQHFLRELRVVFRPVRAGSVRKDRLSKARGFGQADIAADAGLKGLRP